MKPTLMLILEKGRAILHNALSRVINETALPAYLIEGILLDLLADVRAQKATELAAEYEETLKQIPPPAATAPAQTEPEQTTTESEG